MADARVQKKLRTGHHPSALKRARQNEKQRVRRRGHLTKMKTQIKQLRAAVEQKDKKTASELLKKTLPLIAKMAGKKIVHSRTAARYASRLTLQVNNLP